MRRGELPEEAGTLCIPAEKDRHRVYIVYIFFYNIYICLIWYLIALLALPRIKIVRSRSTETFYKRSTSSDKSFSNGAFDSSFDPIDDTHTHSVWRWTHFLRSKNAFFGQKFIFNVFIRETPSREWIETLSRYRSKVLFLHREFLTKSSPAWTSRKERKKHSRTYTIRIRLPRVQVHANKVSRHWRLPEYFRK